MSSSGNRLLLIDNDAFVRFAGSGHFEKILAGVGVELAQCRYNAPFPFVYRRSIRPSLPPTLADRIDPWIDRMRPLELAPSAGIEQQLIDAPDIDVGEAVLIGVLAEHETTLLTTNDRRALRALSSLPELAEIRQAVAGRVIVMEPIIDHLVRKHGIEAIAPGFAELALIDARLSIIFSANNLAHADQCQDAIRSYLNDTIQELGHDLLASLE